jgi:ankyrin repeat protein
VERLIAAPGVDVNKARTTDGVTPLTPLITAAYEGHLDVVERLIAAPGVDVNKSCNTGQTPLFIALRRRHADVAQILFAAGANTLHG